QVRPEGATLNQMMIAIYQANPEVFMHNINRMKAGYILRMPAASDVQAVSVADANAEVRAQMESWHNNRTASTPAPPAGSAEAAQPALQLVAPSSAAESNAPVPGAEKQGNGEAAKGEKPAKPEVAAETAATPPPAPTSATPPANQAPLAVNNNALAGVQQQAAQQNAQPAPAVLPPPEPAKNVPLAPPAASKPTPAPVQAQESGGGIMDAIFNIYVLGALVVVAIVVLLGVMIKKRKKAAPSAFSAGGTMRIKGADWMKQEQAGGNDKDDTAAASTTRTRSKMKKAAKPAEEKPEDKTVLVAPPTEVAAGDDSDKTMLMSAPPPMQAPAAGGGGGGSKLDVSDPMAEADFHMAYGLYDQAADVLRKALRQSPDRHDIQVKLLEVFFTAGDKDNFVSEAKKLRQSMGATPSKEWESVAIMGRQVAPDEALFSASGSSGGTAAVDIALETGGTDTVVSDLGDAFDSGHAPQAVRAPAPAAPAAAADNLMDFSLPDLEPTPAAAPVPAAVPAAAPAATPQPGGMEFNLGDLNFEPTPPKKGKEEKAAPTLSTDEPTVATDFGTDSQVEFDKALNDLAAFVNTNVPAQPEAAEPAGGGGLSMEGTSAPAMAAGGDEPAGSSISEIGTKLDLARAYIDMGDPDGAKSILAEVIGEGNAQQKQEAQELLKHVS
ncbi:MAG TPA: FimV/HubP family polar landmark protein, partial [Gammaproteobacteria bacterium]|nr:FimV/HubP family polar landmark protein [Gammaproteobacteria bacterium]